MFSFINRTISRLYATRAMSLYSKHDDSKVSTSFLLSIVTGYPQSLQERAPIAVLPDSPWPYVEEFFKMPQKMVLSSPQEQRGSFFQMGAWSNKWEAGLFRGSLRPSSAGTKLLSHSIESSENSSITISFNSCRG